MTTNIVDENKRYIYQNVDEFKSKYNLHLIELSKFPVWARAQILYYLHINNDTLKKFVLNGFLYEFKIRHHIYYSIKNKEYSNLIIRKSIMQIDSYYRIHYETLNNFVFDSSIDSKSLISNNVERVGYIFVDNIDYYNVYLCNPPRFSFDSLGDVLVDKKIIDYLNKISKLLIDIKCNSKFEKVYVHLIIPNASKCFNFFNSYLEEKLIEYNCSGYYTLGFRFVNVNYSNFNELLL